MIITTLSTFSQTVLLIITYIYHSRVKGVPHNTTPPPTPSKHFKRLQLLNSLYYMINFDIFSVKTIDTFMIEYVCSMCNVNLYYYVMVYFILFLYSFTILGGREELKVVTSSR